MFDILHNAITLITEIILTLGYVGIFILMFIESSFLPFPSEIIIIPAGFLAAKSQMNMNYIILSGVLGSLSGALFNYYLAKTIGIKFLYNYGKYFYVSHKSLDKVQSFFNKHGAISTFVGRLLPGIRQYISLPAGLSQLNLKIFITYTTLGSFIWVSILAVLGYFFGHGDQMSDVLLHKTILLITMLSAILILSYVLYYRISKSKVLAKNFT